jgi:hypothetical protein
MARQLVENTKKHDGEENTTADPYKYFSVVSV